MIPRHLPGTARSLVTRRRFLGLSLALGGVGLAGCSRGGSDGDGPDQLVAWPAKDQWPARLTAAQPAIQEAYRYVVANPDIMQYVPCFCGCVAQGHRSALDCYVDEYRDDGSVLLDPMSFG